MTDSINFNKLLDIRFKKIKPETIISYKEVKEFCTYEYIDHPNGCPNVKKCKSMNLPLFRTVKHLNYYLLYGVFDFKTYKSIRKEQHPEWTSRMVKNLLYYQSSVKRLLRLKIEEIYQYNGFKFYVYACGSGMNLSFQEKVGSMELSGINVFSTLKLNSIDYEIKPITKIVFCNLLCSKNEIKYLNKRKKFY